MSYHNGSIWPHDNALIAAGLARYGHTEQRDAGVRRARSMRACISMRTGCRSCSAASRGAPAPVPTLYPVACSPQAWAAAAVFGMLQACLGLEVRSSAPEIVLHTPRLPPFLDWIRISRLGAPGPSIDIVLQRHERNVGVEVIRKDAGVTVMVVA